MPVRRDPRTGRWFFRSSVHLPDGATVRIFGTPGTAGAYADLPNTKAGAIEAEKRAIAETLNRKEVETPTKAMQTIEPVPAGKTIKEHAKTFLEMYKPDQKPSERRAKKQI